MRIIVLLFFVSCMLCAFCMNEKGEDARLLQEKNEEETIGCCFLLGRGCNECVHGECRQGYVDCEQGGCPCFFDQQSGWFREDPAMGRCICYCSLAMIGLGGAGIYGAFHPNGWFR